jgi:hypothetical protein
MTSLTREVWGRELDLRVSFEDLDDVGVGAEQWAALGHIILKWDAVDGSLPALQKYYREQNPSELEGMPDDNAFRYVMPKYLFVPQGVKKRTVALMCDYRFDPEHGLALVFENETLREIGPQDVIL